MAYTLIKYEESAMLIEFEVLEITPDILEFNPTLNPLHVGKFGVVEEGSKRVIEITDTPESAQQVIEAVINHES